MIEDVVKFIQDLIDKWNALDDDTKIVIITIGTLAASIGPLITLLGGISSAIAFISSPIGIAVIAIAALAAAFIYVLDNWEAFKERFADIGWWQNAIIQMLQWFIEYNPLALLYAGFNDILEFFGRNPIPDPFEMMVDGLEDLKVETKDYENEFGSFKRSIVNGAEKAKNAIMDIAEGFGFGGGNSGGNGGGNGTGKSSSAGTKNDGGNNDGGGEDDPVTQMTNRLIGLKNIAQELSNTIAESLSTSFATAVTSGQNFGQSMVQIFKDIAKQLVAMIVKAMVLAALFTYLGIGDAKGMSQSAGFFKNFETSLTGKAGGGAVVAGQPYMVGEKGPEMFMPGQSGTIIPNNNVGGTIIPDVKITGDDLLIVFDKAQRRKERR